MQNGCAVSHAIEWQIETGEYGRWFDTEIEYSRDFSGKLEHLSI